jgi:diguanylate cyclase (GGDEF)-like protein
MWVTVLPPISFFLLGRRPGAWICGVVFLYVGIYFYLQMPHQPALPVSMGSLLNIVEVMIAQWFLFMLYERSRAEAYTELERLSETDKLTGLFNRSRLDILLMQEFCTHSSQGQPLTLIIADIDHFKRINDEYGHLTGDAILKDIATVLRNSMRTTDYCGRWGGEEFLFICTNTPENAAEAIVSKLQAALAQAKLAQDIQVTMSFGIATLAQDISAEHQLRRADDALYQAKRQGRNRSSIA